MHLQAESGGSDSVFAGPVIAAPRHTLEASEADDRSCARNPDALRMCLSYRQELVLLALHDATPLFLWGPGTPPVVLAELSSLKQNSRSSQAFRHAVDGPSGTISGFCFSTLVKIQSKVFQLTRCLVRPKKSPPAGCALLGRRGAAKGADALLEKLRGKMRPCSAAALPQ